MTLFRSVRLLGLVVIVIGSSTVVGCGAENAAVLGKDPGKAELTAVRDLKSTSKVVLAGTMIEKCPTAGCWFMLKDETGVVRVDTKSAGFTVTDVAVNSTVTVCGTVKDGSERSVVASGMRY